MELQSLKVGFGVKVKERYTHILLMGKSGTGKSTSILNWWRDDSFWKYSKILIEPSGFLAKDCYSIMKGKVHYCSLKHPLSLNPLQTGYDPNIISETVAECVNQVVSITTPNQSFTVKMRDILDESIKYCLSHNQYSLLNVKDGIANQKGDAQTRDGILARLNFLLNDEMMVKILCGNNSVKWGELIRKGESFILDCQGMSREKMIFVGNILTQGIKNYFRYEQPLYYSPCAVYIDECHNFVNSYLFDVLKEGRKYKLSICLSSQDFAVIPEQLKRLMLNVGNIICFRVGANEAQSIAREMDMTATDLQFLEKYHCAYMTAKERGICKAASPPFIKKMEIKKVEPKIKSKGWFTLESYQDGSPQ